jgi:SAM-dependent methyltransferase
MTTPTQPQTPQSHAAADAPSAYTPTTPLDGARLEAFVNRVLGDWGGALGTVMGLIGDRLGLYRAMAGAGPLTTAELAERSGTAERYVREWLMNQAAGGYVDYDAATGRYTLPPEHAAALLHVDAPYYVAGGFEVISAATRAAPRLEENFRTGAGMFWGEHDPGLFSGTERFFRPGYATHLVQEWIPALEGMREKLERGARVADVGCGHGASTILMAAAFPNSRFVGYDFHPPSVEHAGRAAAHAGVGDRATFERAGVTDFPGGGYDLVTFFDCYHDLGDPVGAARHAYEALAPDGTMMLVEPMAGEHVEENLHAVGRVFTGASVLICTPNALASGPGPVLGTQATEAALREAVTAGGFTRFRRVAETPFNRVFEARR